jgi:hypothetical protein
MTGFFINRKGWYEMKFLMIVLGLRFIAALIDERNRKNREADNRENETQNMKVFHPSEYALRDS